MDAYRVIMIISLLGNWQPENDSPSLPALLGILIMEWGSCFYPKPTSTSSPVIQGPACRAKTLETTVCVPTLELTPSSHCLTLIDVWEMNGKMDEKMGGKMGEQWINECEKQWMNEWISRIHSAIKLNNYALWFSAKSLLFGILKPPTPKSSLMLSTHKCVPTPTIQK